ncbi:hypothetical protein ACWDYH_30565 [Nocardia goodfellowii]
MTVENTVNLQKKAAVDTKVVHDRLETVANEIQAQLDALIAMVGSDPVFGAKFTDDPNGLKVRLQGALTGTRTMAKTWGELADGQTKTAADKEKEEDARVRGLLPE